MKASESTCFECLWFKEGFSEFLEWDVVCDRSKNKINGYNVVGRVDVLLKRPTNKNLVRIRYKWCKEDISRGFKPHRMRDDGFVRYNKFEEFEGHLLSECGDVMDGMRSEIYKNDNKIHEYEEAMIKEAKCYEALEKKHEKKINKNRIGLARCKRHNAVKIKNYEAKALERNEIIKDLVHQLKESESALSELKLKSEKWWKIW